MITSCAVVGCAKCHVKGVMTGFCCFPLDGKNDKFWITTLQRKNAGGSDWIPGEGDQVYEDHFIALSTYVLGAF